jgi:hypothetical protein
MFEEGVLDLKTEDGGAEEIDERVRDEAAGSDGGAILAKSGMSAFLCGFLLSEDI